MQKAVLTFIFSSFLISCTDSSLSQEVNVKVHSNFIEKINQISIGDVFYGSLERGETSLTNATFLVGNDYPVWFESEHIITETNTSITLGTADGGKTVKIIIELDGKLSLVKE